MGKNCERELQNIYGKNQKKMSQLLILTEFNLSQSILLQSSQARCHFAAIICANKIG